MKKTDVIGSFIYQKLPWLIVFQQSRRHTDLVWRLTEVSHVIDIIKGYVVSFALQFILI